MTAVSTSTAPPMTTAVLDNKRVHAAFDLVKRDLLSLGYTADDLDEMLLDQRSFEVPAIRMAEVEWNWALRVSLELVNRFANIGVRAVSVESSSSDDASADILLLYPR